MGALRALKASNRKYHYTPITSQTLSKTNIREDKYFCKIVSKTNLSTFYIYKNMRGWNNRINPRDTK
jgi:hypothetical protein